MNSFEQILIRMGLDAKAVVTGLTKVSSFAKGWAAGFVNDMKTTMGRMFVGFIGVQGLEMAGSKVIQFLEETNQKIIAIKNDARSFGVSTNFVQGIMMEAAKSGYSFEQIEKPLAHLNELLGQAKDGSVKARSKLVQFGLATVNTKWESLNLTTSLERLAYQHQHAADAATRNYREHELFGKGFEVMIPILQQGAVAISKLNEDNFFTKINPQTIDFFTGMFGGKQVGQGIATATGANLTPKALQAGAGQLNPLLGLATGVLEHMAEVHGHVIQAQQAEVDKQQESIEFQLRQVELANQLAELTQKRYELERDITDRNKPTIEAMADRTRKLLGLPTPESLNYTISPRDMQALQIDTMERQAKIAYERGQDKVGQGLTNAALQARAGFAGTTRAEQFPLQRTEMELVNLNRKMEPVQKMAEMVNSEHAKPK